MPLLLEDSSSSFFIGVMEDAILDRRAGIGIINYKSLRVEQTNEASIGAAAVDDETAFCTFARHEILRCEFASQRTYTSRAPPRRSLREVTSRKENYHIYT